MTFEPYPFEKLNTLLANITPNNKYDFCDLTIGEPQFDTPKLILDSLKDNVNLLNKYPKSGGEIYLKESMINFVSKRFDVKLEKNELIPTFGTREVLFNFPQFLLFDIKNPTMAFSNPFYQIYEGAAIASKADIVYLNLNKENDFKPNIDDERLKNCDLVIINSPNNPTSSVILINELENWVKKALEYNFVLLNDECYSEIYFDNDKKPASLLQASINVGNLDFKNILVINSISKRSSAPGLRSGFIAGDAKILKEYGKYRTYVGCASPLPLQKSASTAWNDENHKEFFVQNYKTNMQLASKILGVNTSNSTFYVWLDVQNGEEFAKELFEKYNVKVLPGIYLGREEAGKEYIRIALIQNSEKCEDILNRINKIYKKNQ